jgi:electron transfer flavoprotein alpha subunit
MSKILVIAEHRDGELKEATLELCSAAKDIAAGLGAEAAAAVFGKDDTLAQELAKYIPEVLSVTDPKLENYTADGYAEAVKGVADSEDVKGILIPHSYDGVDFAGKAAMLLGAGIVSNCNRAVVEGGELVLSRNTYNGKIQEEKKVKTEKFVITFEKGAFPVAEAGSGGSVKTVSASIGDVRTKVLETIETMAGSVDISQAKILVTGGRGVKDGDKYKEVIIPLAEKLGGEYAATRPVVDSGWTDAARQVGQSGKTVTPDLYIAAGVSGSIQHIAGMKGSQCIVAVNKDPEAPIFNIATYGIVGDLFEVLPAMLEKL